MGLAEFVKLVIRSLFPEVFSQTVPIGGIDNLAIDANGTLHDARSYFEGGESTLRRIMNQERETTLNGYFAEFQKRLRSIIGMCGPIDSKVYKVKDNIGLMIAIDGVAPRAKLLQQRMRRHSVVSNPVFDSNAISPYTDFMKEIHGRILDMLNETGKRAQLPRNIIYNSYQIPGEGEQKIFMKLANNGLDNTRPTVIYGLDSDLILMGLMSDAKQLYLMRESYSPRGRRQTFINISSLREGIATYLGGGRDKVMEFSAITLLFGNDFLPPIPGLTYYTQFHRVVEVYKAKGLKLVDVDNIGLSGLLGLLEALPADQLLDLHIEESLQRLKVDANRQVPRIRDTYLGHLTQPNYRDHYYAYVDPNPDTTKQTIISMCVNWVQMLNWTYNYFRFYANAVSKVDAYEYTIAPMLTDVVEVLRVMTSIPPALTPGKIHPYAALLMILPHSSISVCPGTLQRVFEKLPKYPYIVDEYLSNRNVLIAPWQDYKKFNELAESVAPNMQQGLELLNNVQPRPMYTQKLGQRVTANYVKDARAKIAKATADAAVGNPPPSTPTQAPIVFTTLKYVRHLTL